MTARAETKASVGTSFNYVIGGGPGNLHHSIPLY